MVAFGRVRAMVRVRRWRRSRVAGSAQSVLLRRVLVVASMVFAVAVIFAVVMLLGADMRLVKAAIPRVAHLLSDVDVPHSIVG
jgi:hypothetical protein